MKKTILIIMVFAFVCVAKAQKEVYSEEFLLKPPEIDYEKVDPYLHFCGIVRELDINCSEKGTGYIGEDKVWRKQITIQSMEAVELKIIFQKFLLSPNAIISFYTDSLRYRYKGDQFLQNPEDSYITHFLNGDRCTIVIEIPIEELDKNEMIISKIVHFIESFDATVKAATSDYSCLIDVNCSEGNDWCNEKRSVAIYYFIQDGYSCTCTGALVNNYRNDFTQYFLTARHCTNKTIDWKNTEFYFNYQATSCNGKPQTFYYNGYNNEAYYRVQGSQLKASCDFSWSDNALLLITQPIPLQYNVYYAGVDRMDRSAGDKVTCMNHSLGKPKQIMNGQIKYFAGPKWDVYWNNGIIMGGGSGGPVFLNSNKRVIATISGGPTYDCNSSLKHDWVGKLKACDAITDVLFGSGSSLVSFSGRDPIQACQKTINLSGGFYDTHIYDATLDGQTIQAGSEIIVNSSCFEKNAHFTLTAGDKIVFRSGTRIESGARVAAKIAPCSNYLVFCGKHTSEYKSSKVAAPDDDNDEFADAQFGDLPDVTLYPNPNNGSFTLRVNFDPQEVLSVQVFNVLGQEVYQQTGLQTSTIQLPPSVQGFFWVKVTTSTETFTKKMVVQ